MIQACNFIRKRLQHRYFPVINTKILRALTLKNIYERLLLKIYPVLPFWFLEDISEVAVILQSVLGRCFSWPWFISAQIFLGPGFSGFRSRVRVQVLDVAVFQLGFYHNCVSKIFCDEGLATFVNLFVRLIWKFSCGC